MPTVDQAFACVRVCQMLSNCYRDIHLFRYDRSSQLVYILAGDNDELEVIIPANGIWRFINEAEL